MFFLPVQAVQSSTHTKCLIIGAGPAGYTAAIYAARSAMQPIIVAGPEKGGQLTYTTVVENFPGFSNGVSSKNLMTQMETQAKRMGASVWDTSVTAVDFSKKPFVVKTASSKVITADSVIIATGAKTKWLDIQSEVHYKGYGVSSCATCDGFLYQGKVVGVVGGGDAAAQEALDLATVAKRVYVLHRGDKMRAQSVLQMRLHNDPKIHILRNTQVYKILGDGKGQRKHVTGILLTKTNGKQKPQRLNIKLNGVFVAIGHAPDSDLFKGQLSLHANGYIKVEPGTTKTSIPGVFAAGDVADSVYRQAITAAGLGCMAALDAKNYINKV